MNKYTAAGLLAAATAGERIIVVSPHARAVTDAVDDVHRIAPDLQWRRTNGDQRVTFPSGGSIRFLTHCARLRGHAADVVLVEDDSDLRDDDFRRDLHSVVRASPLGEIVRY